VIDKIINIALAYIEWGMQFFASHLMTIEGMIAVMFGLFLVGLISQIRG